MFTEIKKKKHKNQNKRTTRIFFFFFFNGLNLEFLSHFCVQNVFNYCVNFIDFLGPFLFLCIYVSVLIIIFFH